MSRTSFIRSLQGFPRAAIRTPIAMIVRSVASSWGVDVDELMSKCRRHKVAHARQEIFRRADLVNHSQTDIAKFFDAHPTTVSFGIRAATNRIN